MKLVLVGWQLAVIVLLFGGVVLAINGLTLAVRRRSSSSKSGASLWPVYLALSLMCWWAAVLLCAIKG